jgi:hypothetical protein
MTPNGRVLRTIEAGVARPLGALFRAIQGPTLMITLKAFIALVVIWCLLAVAAIVAASIQRFEDLYMYVVAAAVFVGLIIVAAIAMAP